MSNGVEVPGFRGQCEARGPEVPPAQADHSSRDVRVNQQQSTAVPHPWALSGARCGAQRLLRMAEEAGVGPRSRTPRRDRSGRCNSVDCANLDELPTTIDPTQADPRLGKSHVGGWHIAPCRRGEPYDRPTRGRYRTMCHLRRGRPKDFAGKADNGFGANVWSWTGRYVSAQDHVNHLPIFTGPRWAHEIRCAETICGFTSSSRRQISQQSRPYRALWTGYVEALQEIVTTKGSESGRHFRRYEGPVASNCRRRNSIDNLGKRSRFQCSKPSTRSDQCQTVPSEATNFRSLRTDVACECRHPPLAIHFCKTSVIVAW